LENYFRSGAALAESDREIIILATVREFDARFPWTRHEIRGRQVGLREEVIETLRAKGSLERFAPRERLLIEIVRSLLRDHRLSKELFTLGLAELGAEKMVEMVALIGHYCMISSVANAFEVAPPEGSRTF
jgi:4-carboxymuconolactone decarboxylase